uniref:CCHC-type domain-containing protein n=1 Tax=Tanacetum cinerariifolium TaxID=118510 RepID=A0A6L2K3V0_TANCI|nr:hypothetical protein [Tanacetum cinerariifolium]
MIKVLPSKTAKEVVSRERERKSRTTLLMALPEDHLAKFHKMADAKEMWEAIKSRFGGNDESKKMQKYLLKQQFEGFSVSGLGGLHKGYDRSLPSSWSHVALIMRTKPGLDTLSFDDLYNNLRVFKRDVNVTTASSSNIQNVAFVSTDNTSNTNDINDDYMEEMDLKWQVAIISMRIKKFHKRTRRKLQFDTKDPIGFDKTKVECFNCHKIGHFARDCIAKGNQDSRRDAGYNGKKARDNGRRHVYQDASKALVTIDGEDIDWSGHTLVDESDAKTSEYTSCESNSSVETTTSMPAPVEIEPKVVCEPKVWTDAPIIEEYELDSDDDLVSNDDPHRALKDKGIVNSGYSRHMTGNKVYLADYQEFKGSSVAFEGSNGRITGIKREYSNARTLQQNRVAERKNKTLIEAARTMVLVTKHQNKTPYELLTSKQPIISYLRPFWYHVTILNTIDQLGKFDQKFDSRFLVGYSLNSKAFKVYNLETKRVEENLHVNFLENKPNVAGKGHAWMFDLDYLTNSVNYEPVLEENQANKSAGLKEANNSAGDKIEKTIVCKTCEKPNANTNSTNLLNDVSIPISIVGPSRAFNDGEPSYPDDPLMHRLKDIYASTSKEIFTDSSYDDEGVINDFNNLETTMTVSLTPTTRIHAIHPKTQILGDPMSAVQTRSKVNKNYEAHALKSWCDKFEELMKNRIQMSSMGELTFILGLHVNQTEDGIFISQDKYVAEILKKSMIGSLMYLTASRPEIMFVVCTCSRFHVTPKTSHLQAVKRIFRYLKGQPKLGLWFPKVSSFNLEAYSDSDYAGANLDRKSTTEGCQFLGRRLIS